MPHPWNHECHAFYAYVIHVYLYMIKVLLIKHTCIRIISLIVHVGVNPYKPDCMHVQFVCYKAPWGSVVSTSPVIKVKQSLNISQINQNNQKSLWFWSLSQQLLVLWVQIQLMLPCSPVARTLGSLAAACRWLWVFCPILPIMEQAMFCNILRVGIFKSTSGNRDIQSLLLSALIK